jgi:hypothetical protein
MPFSVTKQDLLRSKVVTPGVYLLTIKSIKEGPGKNDPQSTVTTVEMEIKSGPDTKAVGVPISYWLSEKAPGMAVGFLEAVSGKKVPEDGMSVPDWSPYIGREVKAFIKNEMYNNRPTNKVDGFMAA